LGPTRTALISLNAAQALQRCGDTVESRRLLEAGLAQCIRVPIPELQDAYAIELAHLALDSGDRTAADSLLAQSSPDEGSRLGVRRAILSLRSAMQRGDRAVAFESVARRVAPARPAGSDTLRLSPRDTSLSRTNDELRRAGHELLDASPAAGYGSRDVVAHASRAAPASSGIRGPPSSPVSRPTRSAPSPRSPRAMRSTVFSMFATAAIARFTASSGGIVEDRVTCDVGTLRAAVDRVRSRMQPASDRSPFQPDASADLRDLGQMLLPVSVRRSGAPRLLLVTANGCLAELPFATLDVGNAGHYVPLADSTDFAWVRYWNRIDAAAGRSARDAAVGDSALVVSQPSYSASLRRRHSALNEVLPASAQEASDVARLLPRCIALTGSAATKSNLVERWERARLLYVAGHFVQDPEIPYVMFVPMSATSDRHPESGYLEVANVRAANLSRLPARGPVGLCERCPVRERPGRDAEPRRCLRGRRCRSRGRHVLGGA
jgi:hypothetical protein